MPKGNGAVKTKSVADQYKILYTVLPEDRAPLAYVEAHLAAEAKAKDVLGVTSASVIRYCIRYTYNKLTGKRLRTG